MMKNATVLVATLSLSLGVAGAALAADPAACRTVRMSDPGWSDITSTNALAGVVLDGLGYEQKVETLGVPNTDFAAAARDAHLLVIPAGDNIVRLLPPLTIGETEIDEAVRRLDAAASSFEAVRGAAE